MQEHKQKNFAFKGQQIFVLLIYFFQIVGVVVQKLLLDGREIFEMVL